MLAYARGLLLARARGSEYRTFARIPEPSLEIRIVRLLQGFAEQVSVRGADGANPAQRRDHATDRYTTGSRRSTSADARSGSLGSSTSSSTSTTAAKPHQPASDYPPGRIADGSDAGRLGTVSGHRCGIFMLFKIAAHRLQAGIQAPESAGQARDGAFGHVGNDRFEVRPTAERLVAQVFVHTLLDGGPRPSRRHSPRGAQAR